jgi:putative DNA primase/helicase
MSDNDFLPTVSDLFAFLDAKQSGHGKWWRAVCPVHGSKRGRSRTLAMMKGDQQPVVFECHAGCTHIEIQNELAQQGMWPVQPDPEHQPISDAEEDAANAKRWARVLQIDNELVSAKGTRVERYLRLRAITLLPEQEIAYHPRLFHDLDGTNWPAMVAAVRDVDGKLLGLIRTYLAYHKPAKAPVDPPKLSLGFVRGGSAHLAPAGPTLIIGEGIETVLSVMQATELPGWAALGNKNMVNLDLPGIVREVLVAVDRDKAGERAGDQARRHFRMLGRSVRLMRPPQGVNDFNDLLQRGT